ncbi:hypothetical protein PAMA_019953 [Pampus argenteus]
MPARCDGQPRRGSNSSEVSRHRLKVETNVDISIRSLFMVTSGLPGDAASSTCNKTPPPSKRFFKASAEQRTAAAQEQGTAAAAAQEQGTAAAAAQEQRTAAAQEQKTATAAGLCGTEESLWGDNHKLTAAETSSTLDLSLHLREMPSVSRLRPPLGRTGLDVASSWRTDEAPLSPGCVTELRRPGGGLNSSQGQLAAGTCEVVTLDRDSSQPRRTIARQTARCACKKGQIAGTTRARPACVDGHSIVYGLAAKRLLRRCRGGITE